MKFFKIGLFLLFLAIYPSSPQAEEAIKIYDVNIKINSDSSMDIVENITINSEEKNIRLGIYRDIPKFYYIHGKPISTPVKILSVERNGEPENFWLEDNGSFMRIQIGAVEDTFSNYIGHGLHSYVIRWKTLNHIRGFYDYDELYFNATGNKWDFPIEKASVTISLPEEVEIKQTASYIGYDKSKERAEQFDNLENNTVTFYSPRKLAAKEGLTVAVGFTKGVIITSSEQTIVFRIIDKIMEIGAPYISFDSAIVLLLGIIVFTYYMVVWYLYGKDDDLGTIVPTFNPPQDISPAEVSAILYKKNTQKAFIASIVSLVSQGFILMKEKSLTKSSQEKEPVFVEQKQIMQNLFSKNSKVSLSKYQSGVSTAFADFAKSLKIFRRKFIKKDGIFVKIAMLFHVLLLFSLPDSGSIIAVIVITSLISLFYLPFYYIIFALFKSKSYFGGILFSLFILPHSFGFIFLMPATVFYGDGALLSPEYYIFISLSAMSIFMHFFFNSIMDKPQPKTVKLLNQLQGLRMFMELTDKERYKYITPSIFERNLPYAILFGLEKNWLEMFELYYPEDSLDWYEKNNFHLRNLSSLSGGIYKARIAPVSSSSGRSSGRGGGFGSSSGSRGGGRSGGGSGGGGGGGR